MFSNRLFSNTWRSIRIKQKKNNHDILPGMVGRKKTIPLHILTSGYQNMGIRLLVPSGNAKSGQQRRFIDERKTGRQPGGRLSDGRFGIDEAGESFGTAGDEGGGVAISTGAGKKIPVNSVVEAVRLPHCRHIPVILNPAPAIGSPLELRRCIDLDTQ